MIYQSLESITHNYCMHETCPWCHPNIHMTLLKNSKLPQSSIDSTSLENINTVFIYYQLGKITLLQSPENIFGIFLKNISDYKELFKYD